MRFAFLLSGAGGFCLVVIVGLASDRDIDPVLRDASIACLLCAFVGRWFWQGLESAFARTLADRRAAAEAAEAEAQPAPAGVPAAAARAATSAAKPTVPARPPAPAAAAPSRR